jgi:hypothetical protein
MKKKKNTTPTEQESRQRLIEWARSIGAEADILRIFARYDDLLKGAKTQEEYNAIGALGCVELDKFFSGKGYSTLSETQNSNLSKFGDKKNGR